MESTQIEPSGSEESQLEKIYGDLKEYVFKLLRFFTYTLYIFQSSNEPENLHAKTAIEKYIEYIRDSESKQLLQNLIRKIQDLEKVLLSERANNGKVLESFKFLDRNICLSTKQALP